MQVLCLCHSLVPCMDEKTGQIVYRTPSPDELALHEWAVTNGFRFLRRDSDSLTYMQGGTCSPPFSIYPQFMWLDTEVRVRLLADLEFTSARARMSVLVQEENGTILLLTKGADSEIYKRLRAGDDDIKTTLSEDLKFFSKQGFRTLVLGVRTFAAGELDEWLKNYREVRLISSSILLYLLKPFAQASTSLEDRDQQLAAVYEQIETNFDLGGCAFPAN